MLHFLFEKSSGDFGLGQVVNAGAAAELVGELHFDELEPGDLRLGCTLNGVPIQDGSTLQMRFSIADVIAYLSRHVMLRPGDVIATGTPARLTGPMGPERHLQAGDVVTVWIEQIGELTTTVA